MSNRPRWSSRRTDTQSPDSTLGRRRILSASAVAASLAIAGCLDDTAEDDNSGDDAEDSDDADADDSADDADPVQTDDPSDDPVALVTAYLEAASDGDVEALSEYSHSLNPLDPAAWEEDGWEFQGGDDAEDVDIADLEIDLRTDEASIEDVLDLEGAEFWFGDVDLEAELEGEELAIVEVVDATDDDPLTERGVWALATEDDDWRLLVMSEEREIPDDPEEVFEEELIDEDQDVVAEIDWEYDQDTGDGEFGDDLEWAQVEFTDEPGIEADAVRVESTIEGGESELYDPDGEPGGWSNSWVTISLHPEGDQVVVTAINDGEETVVHREHFEP